MPRGAQRASGPDWRTPKKVATRVVFSLDADPTRNRLSPPSWHGWTAPVRLNFSPGEARGGRGDVVDIISEWKGGVISMWSFEQPNTERGTTAMIEVANAPYVLLGGGFFRFTSGSPGEAATEIGEISREFARSSARVDGMLRAGRLVPLGSREYAPGGFGFAEVVCGDDWDDDDGVADDDDDDDEEDDDDDFFPDDTDDFDDDEEDDEEGAED